MVLKQYWQYCYCHFDLFKQFALFIYHLQIISQAMGTPYVSVKFRLMNFVQGLFSGSI